MGHDNGHVQKSIQSPVCRDSGQMSYPPSFFLSKTHTHTHTPFDELAHVCVMQLYVEVRFDPIKEGGGGRITANALRYLVQHLLRECLQKHTQTWREICRIIYNKSTLVTSPSGLVKVDYTCCILHVYMHDLEWSDHIIITKQCSLWAKVISSYLSVVVFTKRSDLKIQV